MQGVRALRRRRIEANTARTWTNHTASAGRTLGRDSPRHRGSTAVGGHDAPHLSIFHRASWGSFPVGLEGRLTLPSTSMWRT